MRDRKSLNITLVVYFIIFYAIWALIELVFVPMTGLDKNPLLSSIIKEGVIKRIVWLIPAIILSRKYNELMYVKKDTIFSFKVNWLKYIPIFIILTAYVLVGTYIINGTIALNKDFAFSDIVWLSFVGITEEMVFRGWLLNATITENKKWLPIIINSLLFLLIHFPIWIQEGCFVDNILSGGFIIIIVLSVIFSWTFVKSKSIMVAVVLHMFYDFIATIIAI